MRCFLNYSDIFCLEKCNDMKCKKCSGKLKILRMCSKVRMQCNKCGEEYHIHEVSDQLDKETEEMLASYTSIIYD
ncbi:dual CXXC motif small (seleno)protein [Thermodesulfobacteriota bacterium]